jgi:hypothetical protein
MATDPIFAQPTRTAGADEPAARPKVLRRPSQFSHVPATPAEAPPEQQLPALLPNARPAPAATVSHGWQEDSRFGLLLIAVLVVVNGALALLLPLLPAPDFHSEPNTLQQNTQATMPSSHAKATKEPITIYAEPRTRTRDDGMSLDSLPSDYNIFETEPATLPVPRARSIDESEGAY